MRARTASMPSAPGMPPPLPGAAQRLDPAALSPGSSAIAAPPPLAPPPVVAAPAPSGAPYIIAAVAGVIFAVAVGGLGLFAWTRLHPHASTTTAVTEPPPRPTLSAPSVPVRPLPAVSASVAASPPPVASEPPPAVAASASARPSTSTIDISELPTAKAPPVWAPAPAAAPAPRPSAAPAKPSELPANPY
jgi:hypothetical protein